MGIVKEGQLFKAFHKQLGENTYKYIGIEESENGYPVHLFNLTTNTDTFVEKEWFKQRKITIIDG